MKQAIVLGLLGLLFLVPVAEAALLVDTGSGGTSNIGWPSLFDGGGHFQHLGGRFTLNAPATLSSVEGWMGPGSGGSLAVVIRADGAVPGSAIYSKNYTLEGRFFAGWDVFSSYAPTLPAGTYWLCFEPLPGGGLGRGMPGGAPAPLPSYAYLGDGNPGWLQLLPNPGLGMRVSGGPVIVAPLGSAERTIFDAQDGESDHLEGGDDRLEAYYGYISLNGYGWAFGRGAIFANGITAGAEAVNNQSQAASRAVAWRTFQNTTGGTLTFRVNATLHGQFSSGPSSMKATGAVHALDSVLFASTIAASGMPSEEFLLGGNALNGLTGAQDRLNLSLLFPPAARLGSDVEQVNYTPSQVSIALQTGLISVAPNATFTLLYDVSALSTGNGPAGTQFADTLVPAAVPFTDAGGSPVTGLTVLGDSVSVGQTSLLLWDGGWLTWKPALGAAQYRLYRGTPGDLPKLLDANADSCLIYQGAAAEEGPITEDPQPGSFFWYLAVGVNGAVEGSAGEATAGTRLLNSSGVCP